MVVLASPFSGLWIDAIGRSLFVVISTPTIRVSIRQAVDGAPYIQQGLHGSFETLNLEAALRDDGCLEVEAGERHLGPTYRLAREAASASKDDEQLVPSVHMGLYDDYDDDLGVPWAFPLERYRRANETERAASRRMGFS